MIQYTVLALVLNYGQVWLPASQFNALISWVI
jgi:hypothetical protein